MCIKVVIIIMFKDLKENMMRMSEQMDNFSRLSILKAKFQNEIYKS